MIGPGEVSRIASAIDSVMGSVRISAMEAMTMSDRRLSTPVVP